MIKEFVVVAGQLAFRQIVTLRKKHPFKPGIGVASMNGMDWNSCMGVAKRYINVPHP